MTVLEDDENVQAKQTEEDLRLYGSRIEPPEVGDADKGTKLGHLPSKRSASKLGNLTGRPAKASRIEGSIDISCQVVTAMDWNGGASPLDAWLNQSAVPSADSQRLQQQQLCKASSTARELDEIKVFHNVHITDVPQPAQGEAMSNLPDHILRLGLQAQIYYRNILDRYPQLPTYLVCRLAVANHSRAERQRHPKIHASDSAGYSQGQNLAGGVREQEAASNSKNGHRPRTESMLGRANALRLIPQHPTKAQDMKYRCKLCDGGFQSKELHIYHMLTHKIITCEPAKEPVSRPIGKSIGLYMLRLEDCDEEARKEVSELLKMPSSIVMNLIRSKSFHFLL